MIDIWNWYETQMIEIESGSGQITAKVAIEVMKQARLMLVLELEGCVVAARERAKSVSKDDALAWESSALAVEQVIKTYIRPKD